MNVKFYVLGDTKILAGEAGTTRERYMRQLVRMIADNNQSLCTTYLLDDIRSFEDAIIQVRDFANQISYVVIGRAGKRVTIKAGITTPNNGSTSFTGMYLYNERLENEQEAIRTYEALVAKVHEEV